MKKFTILATAFALAASAANAESVTIKHETAGALESELNAAIAASETLTSMADITELTIVGEAQMTATDFAKIRTHLRPSLLYLDLSGAKFANNKLPGGDYDKQGILQTMNVKEVKLPSTLTGLSGGAFYMCKSLETINLPDGVKVISQYCFSGCEKLKLTSLPPNLTTISADAFRGCVSLELTELPETVKSIGGDAFNDDEVASNKLPLTGVAFSKLPRDLEKLGERAFRRTSCTFSEWPENLTTLPSSVFSATKVAFKTLSPNITSVGTYAFQSVKTMPEFIIPDQANLWTKIPDGCFFVQTDDAVRAFVCRAPSAPKATVNIGSGAWSGSFSQVAKNPNTTFRVLASAAKSFKTTAPYSSMNIELLTTEVAAPQMLYADGILPEHVVVKFIADKPADYEEFDEHFPGFQAEHTTFGAVPEGEGHLEISFTDDADFFAYVKEIRWAPTAEAYAEDGETEGDASEEAGEEIDPDLLYTCTNLSQSLKRTISVPVNVTPGMRPLFVEIGKTDLQTGVESVEAPAAIVTRRGDILSLSVEGAELYDLAGRMVASTTSNTLDLGGLPAGAYVLRAHKTAVKIVK
ncbi:MAG: leucine-rich repeat domain-containing protein [[Clostridium] fimetarium]|nr:leucine-rich repeat domain-containing protein [Alistipes timonensis]MCM1405210.1 leucine-rich repeat domain-containing protein [[Clostridium] fimetarium]